MGKGTSGMTASFGAEHLHRLQSISIIIILPGQLVQAGQAQKLSMYFRAFLASFPRQVTCFSISPPFRIFFFFVGLEGGISFASWILVGEAPQRPLRGPFVLIPELVKNEYGALTTCLYHPGRSSLEPVKQSILVWSLTCSLN